MKIVYEGYIYEHFNYDNPLVGGEGDNFKEYSQSQLKKGMAVEKEHIANNPNMSTKQKHAIEKDIVKDHLAEFPEYYDELENMEEKLAEKHKNDDSSKKT